MTFKKRYILIPIIIILFAYFVYISYSELKTLTINDFNNKQMELLDQSKIGVENFFSELYSDLSFLGNFEDVIAENDNGKRFIRNYFKIHPKYLKAITRVNMDGEISYTFPENQNSIGRDISYQTHMKEILKTHKPVLSDVFNAVQGFQAIALHVPIFDGEEFRGTLAFVIDFSDIAETFVGPINASGKSRAIILSDKGTELFCFNKHHVGKNLRENSRDNLSVSKLYDKIMNEKNGFGSYRTGVEIDNKIVVENIQAVYKEIKIANSFWFILVSTPEQTILSPVFAFRNKWFYISLLLTALFAIFIYFTVKASTVLREEDKRKKLEVKLLESELNMQLMMENTPIGIAVVDEKSNPVFLNEKFKRQFGYQLKDVDTMDKWKKNAFPDDEYREYIMKNWKKGIEKSLNENRPSSLNNVKIKCKSGEYKICDASVYALGKIYIIVLVDQTERLKSEKEKHILTERLERSKKMEALGLLASGVAHDLNNILSGLVTLPEILLMKMDENDLNRKKIETIYDCGIRASAVVSDLLTIARGVASKKRVYNLDDIVKDYFESPEFKKMKKNYSSINLICDLNVKSANVFGSDVHIKKCLMNLVNNAFEIIETKGEIRVATKINEFKEDLLRYQKIPAGNYVVLEISDSGMGISGENLNRIFEPFFTRKQMGMSGTGLGLAIVWNTMEDHNGYIDVESELGVGTTFKLYFPITKMENSKTGAYVSINSLKGNGETILIVDDEEIQRNVAKELLSELNYNPTTVESGEEALNIIKKTDFDLILLDMIMPNGMNGGETYTRIKEIKPDQKAIICTGLSSSKDVDNTLGMGASNILNKPYAISELAVIVKDTLEE